MMSLVNDRVARPSAVISSPAVHMERANIKPFVFVFKRIIVGVFVFANATPGQLVDDTGT